MRLHVELRAADLERRGLDPDEARREAERLFASNAETVKALYSTATGRDRRFRMRERLASVRQDAGFAGRSLARDPALSVFIVIALGIGIGATATSWSLLDRLALRPPAHVVDPDRVIRLFAEIERDDQEPFTTGWIPYSAYLQFRALDAFETVGAFRVFERAVGAGAESRRMRVGAVTGSFFPVLGVRPIAGRLFDEGTDASVDGDLAVLGHDLWQSRYGADPDVVGGTIRIHDVPHTIVGVAPAGFSGVERRRVDVWQAARSAESGTVNWNIVGRLRPGVTPEAAAAAATATHRPDDAGSFAWFRAPRMFTAPPGWNSDGQEPLETTLSRWLAAITAIILLITFANVANLLLVRVARRRRELAVRVALGSGRRRVIRLILAECALLAVAGGVASLGVARLLEPVVRSALMADQASWTFTIADGRLLGLVGGIVLVSVLCVALFPAWQAGNPDVVHDLHAGTRGGSSTLRIRSGLTVAQAALSVILLVGAGLFLRSFQNVRALDLGIEREGVLAVEALLPPVTELMDEPGGFLVVEREIYRTLASRVRGLPDVGAAAIAVGVPLDGGRYSASAWVPGLDSLPSLPGGGPWVSSVGAGYFDAIGTAILRGRPFTGADREGSEPVVIVNETMERTLWGEGGAIGGCVHVADRDNPCSRVVGVAEDVHRTGLRERPSLQYYVPLGQQSMFGGAQLLVRPRPGSRLSADALRQTVVDAEPRVWGADVRTLDESVEGEMRPLRIGIVTFGVSGGLALLVAVLGLYSLMAYMVVGRRHEIGVRIALGAGRGDVVGLVVRSGLLLAAIGVAIGLAFAVVGGRWLEPHLFETSANSVPVLAGVAAALLTTAALAGWLPALRASRISPTEALRTE